MMTAAMKLKKAYSLFIGRKAMINLVSIKKQRHYFANKSPSSQSYHSSSSHVWMWDLDYKENWALKNWCFWAVALGKTEYKSPRCQWTYITICKTDTQREFAVWLRELKQGLCVKWEGWDGEGDGREVKRGGDVCTPMIHSCWSLIQNNNSVKHLPFNEQF